MEHANQLAVITGASTGIGYELAACCADHGFDLVIAADESAIHDAARKLAVHDVDVLAVEADLATPAGVKKLYDAITQTGRPVDVLLANAGRGLGRAFLDQDFDQINHVIQTNVTGTICLIHMIGNDMQHRSSGRILITGSIAGFMPGSFQAVYNGTKAFLDSFAIALREELSDSGITVTCLEPGATETEFFRRADMMDTKVGTDKKDNAADVAAAGFKAMMDGESDVVTGLKNKVMSSVANVLPAELLAKQHRKMAEPGTAKRT